MNRLKYTQPFIFLIFISLAWVSKIPFIKKDCKSFECGFYINKRTSSLFQVRSSLLLNCDSSFKYLTSSCINNNTSEGKWTVLNGSIFLYTAKKITALIKKEESKKSIFRKYVDLTGQKLIIDDSLLIWKHSLQHIDTFSISYPGQYALQN